MKQDVIISIIAKQEFQGEEPEVMELLTQGILVEEEAGFKLAYEESEMTGLEGTSTIFLITADSIVLMRQGTVNTQMVFQKNRRHISVYETLYGVMDVEVHTQHVEHSLTGDGGSIEIEYDIEVGKETQGKNFFEIRVELPKTKK